MKRFSFLIAILILVLMGCTEEIDTSNRYVFEGNTVTSYLESHPDKFSEYSELLGLVKISPYSSSTVKQLLSARGHYTVFAPTNDAIYAYLDSLVAKRVISRPSWDAFESEETLDSVREVIVYNSIVDGGDFDYSGNSVLYNTASLPVNNNEELATSNMADRKLAIRYGTGGKDSIFVNDVLMNATNRDIYTINGYIHQMDGVIAPGYDGLTALLQSFIDEKKEGFIVTARLVLACGYGKELAQIRDEEYEQNYKTGVITDLPKHPTEGSIGYIPEHRKYGYTLFAEPDTFWTSVIHGKAAKDITVEEVKGYLIKQGVCPDATTDDNYTSENNIVNQFISYHILPERIPRSKLVVHYNERGYNPKTGDLGVAMYELYTTLGKRRLMKIYESAESNGVYLNRFPKLDNGRKGTYHEVSCDLDKVGVFVDRDNCNTLTQNGIIYPIDKLLWYSTETQENLGKQRLRWDVSSMFPEFMNNDIRGNTVTTARNLTVGIPSDNTNVKYFEDMDIIDGSQFYYLMGRDKGWPNYLGDEFNVIGRYELILRLPPVPRKGVYELRIANSVGVNYRSMCQVYWGTNKDALPAVGVPLDFRMNGLYRLTDAGTFPSIVGWVADDPDDDDKNAEIDKSMRNNGFMKGLQIYCAGSPGTQTMARGLYYETRRIMLTETMDPDKVYYLRLKNVLDDDTKQLFMDFIELCPKEVYDNPVEPEDIW